MVLVRALSKKTVSLFTFLINFGLFVQVESGSLLNATDLCSYLVFHPLIRVFILKFLVFFSETELLKRVNLVRKAVEISSRQSSVDLGMRRLK